MVERKMLTGHTPEILRRKLEDFIARLAKKFGDMKGKIDVSIRPEVSFADIGDLARAKQEIAGLVFALKSPDLHKKWGAQPPNGVLLYGPPGTGKTLLAMALAREAEAVFFHVRVTNVVTKWYADSFDVLQEVFTQVKECGRCILFLDEIDDFIFDRAAPEEMRHASRRLVNSVAEQLDDIGRSGDILAVASTNRPDAVDSTLIRPGRLDQLIEVPLPETDGKREIIQIHMAKAEAMAGRKLFNQLDLDPILARTVKMNSADLAEIVQKSLEEKVRQEGSGAQPGLVTTDDMQRAIEDYRKTKEIIEKIRYGQYL
ncbi:MAG TPA: AAA family ATPase [Acidobacteriota bacterium]|nr:AAA family ATPase [Acidobacteriota bacterium]